jgi:hypothetical protein
MNTDERLYSLNHISNKIQRILADNLCIRNISAQDEVSQLQQSNILVICIVALRFLARNLFPPGNGT